MRLLTNALQWSWTRPTIATMRRSLLVGPSLGAGISRSRNTSAEMKTGVRGGFQETVSSEPAAGIFLQVPMAACSGSLTTWGHLRASIMTPQIQPPRLRRVRMSVAWLFCNVFILATHLSNQCHTMCFRQNEGKCGICYQAVVSGNGQGQTESVKI